MMRSRTILAAVLALCALSVTPARAEEKLKLLIWINGDKGYNGLQKVGDAFEKISGVQVVVQHPEGATDKFQAAAGAGKGPDIFCWPHDRAGEWAKSGLIVPVKAPRRIREEIEASAWSAFTYKGQTWGYPLSIEAIGLIYNKALVKTPPASFDEVIALDKSLAAQGKKAILWDYNKSFFTWPMLAGPGGFIFARNALGDLDPKTIGVNSPGALQGAQMLDRLVRDGHMPKGARYAEMEGGFNRGEIAMMIAGPWAWDNVKKSNIDFGVAPIPGIGGKPAKSFVGVLGCMISAPSKVKDIAREFIENHFCGCLARYARQQKIFCRTLGGPQDSRDDGDRAGRRADSQHPGDGPLFSRDGRGAGSDHQWPPITERCARWCGRSDAGEVT